MGGKLTPAVPGPGPGVFRVVIPARYASSRFPGKPLAVLGGRTMVQCVWEQARASGAAEVVIATDDSRIESAARSFGADVALTSASHRSGTERAAEVAARRGWLDDALVINVQGDAPLIPPASIRRVAELLATHPGAAIATLCTPVRTWAEYQSPHVVKVVRDKDGRALYFSRAPIPARGHGTTREPDSQGPAQCWRHIGLYAYRTGALKGLAAAPTCYLEESEQLEQLRALWLGLEIRVGDAPEAHGPDVDTVEDLAAAEAWLAGRRDP